MGGLVGFVVVALGSWMHDTPLPDTLLRAVVGGVAGNMLAWFGAIVAWQHMLEGEAVAAVRRAAEERRARAERAAAGNRSRLRARLHLQSLRFAKDWTDVRR